MLAATLKAQPGPHMTWPSTAKQQAQAHTTGRQLTQHSTMKHSQDEPKLSPAAGIVSQTTTMLLTAILVQPNPWRIPSSQSSRHRDPAEGTPGTRWSSVASSTIRRATAAATATADTHTSVQNAIRASTLQQNAAGGGTRRVRPHRSRSPHAKPGTQ